MWTPLRETIFIILFFLAASPLSHACSVCFYGDPEQPMNKGLEAGIIVLLGILFVVFGLFAVFFLNFRKRARVTTMIEDIHNAIRNY